MLQELFTFIVREQPTILVGILTAVIAALLVSILTKFTAPLVNKFASRLILRRILKESDRDLDAAVLFHDKHFGQNPRLGDRGIDLKRWIREGEEERRLNADKIEWDEYLIIAKRRRRVVGYLFASYHTPTQFVFLSFIVGKERQGFPAEETVAYHLLKRLLSYFKKGTIVNPRPAQKTFRAIVAELDLEEKTNFGRPMGDMLRDLFGKYAQMLGYPAYIIEGIDYKQPLIDVDVITKRMSEGEVPSNGSQLLFYIPGIGSESVEFISDEDLIDVLKFIITEVYADGYLTDEARWEEYNRYAIALFEKYRDAIRGPAKLSPAYRG